MAGLFHPAMVPGAQRLCCSGAYPSVYLKNRSLHHILKTPGTLHYPERIRENTGSRSAAVFRTDHPRMEAEAGPGIFPIPGNGYFVNNGIVILKWESSRRRTGMAQSNRRCSGRKADGRFKSIGKI